MKPFILKLFLVSGASAATVGCQMTKDPHTTAALTADGECRMDATCVSFPPRDVGPVRPFKKKQSENLTHNAIVMHRGRDVFALEGNPVTVTAKFSYGIRDIALKDEDVDVYLSRGCDQPWEKLGTFMTTGEKLHPPMDNIVDTGGRIFVQLDKLASKPLKVGRYRVYFVVAGDLTTTELYVEIMNKESPIVVTDVDGTLTSSELATATSLIGISPAAHPGAAEMLRAFYRRGYTIHYLTARPEWLTAVSRAWLGEKYFPPGILNTTQTYIGAIGAAASQFKIAEMQLVRSKTAKMPQYAFGNKPSDVEAFRAGKVPAKNTYFYMLKGDPDGGINHSDYKLLVPMAEQAPLGCASTKKP